ncbi:drug/metabolite transporter (DMT)-like permease [Asanoa ferruginea]|uniref:Drug/metabolite transporter (DMT)-like permease n=1 Tax=Asanoa ferruginea TaxID=53367 RepID=A0A3D9ZVH5_9ACTN|nr:DMT family transporter [Asanoa ferruginea]REG01317.1 drug/metabolite transporter (DMT)-like permease [Asanoa ferruginea]GIF52193.1 membrane protein [Asanoa ferruginea]
MRSKSSATVSATVTGLALGALGVLAFSLSLPMTRIAVRDLDPWFVAFGRAVGAALLAWAYLRFTGAPRPTRDQWRRLSLVALGVVVGFPMFTSLALITQTSAHGAVVVTVLPAMTAVFAVLRAGERPPPLFWAASAAGLIAVLAFLIATGAVHGGLSRADLFLIAAVVLCGLGYAEGGALSRELGGARTICWALLLALPVTVPVTLAAAALHPPRAGTGTWAAFGYLTVVSMLLGFFAWYAGLARGGIARVGQIQLAQPVITLAWSALLLDETVTPAAIVVALLVVGCVVLTQRTRSGAPPARTSTPPVIRPATDPARRPPPPPLPGREHPVSRTRAADGS